MVHTCKDFILTNATIYTATERIENGSIFVKDGFIERIEQGLLSKKILLDSKCDVFDAKGMIAGPGLMDMHIHGCGGYDSASINDDDAEKRAIHMEENLSAMSAFLREHGITSFQLAIIPQKETLLAIEQSLSLSLDKKSDWAISFIGVYTEGPFINMVKKGGISAESIQPFTTEYLEELLSYENVITNRSLITTMTLAPEMPHTNILQNKLLKSNVLRAWGHSAAFVDELPFQKNVHLTHLFNAMTGIDHKRAGLASVPFLKQYSDASFELICDGVHVCKELIGFVLSTIGHDRMCLISDGMSQAGLEAGEFEYMGKVCTNNGTTCWYKEDNVLIGSSKLISQTAQDLFVKGFVSVDEFFKIASTNPARVLNLTDRGSLEKGKRADIVLLDKNMNVQEVFCI